MPRRAKSQKLKRPQRRDGEKDPLSELSSSELGAATSAYTSSLDALDACTKQLAKSLAAMMVAHRLSSSGEMSRHRLATRLQTERIMRTVFFIASDLRSRVKIARSVETPSEIDEHMSKFVESLSSAIDSLGEAEAAAVEVRASGGAKKVPPQVRHLMSGVSSAVSVLNRMAKRGRSLVSSHSEVVSDDIASDARGAGFL